MNIAIIPARGGSKRIKNKNSKIFFGKPIISYAIQLALKSKIFEEVIVSSNDKKIIKMSKKYGAKILFKRPKYLSKNHVPIIDVVSHAVKKIIKLNFKPVNICCIFPISPMITKGILVRSLKFLNEKKFNYVFPVTEQTYSNQNKLYIFNKIISKNKRKSQPFFDAGQFYWGTANAWKKKLNIFSDKSGIIHLSSKKFVDVNNLSDWKILEKNYKK
jgi:N-acylneuraminate cytidylyltransferase